MKFTFIVSVVALWHRWVVHIDRCVAVTDEVVQVCMSTLILGQFYSLPSNDKAQDFGRIKLIRDVHREHLNLSFTGMWQ